MTDSRPGVLFDVDGTLVDTNYLHTLAWARALDDAGEWAPMNAIHRLVGMGGDQLVRRLLGHDSPRALRARPIRYRQLLGDARVFPGARDLLRSLHDDGLVVVLATSAPRDELDAMIELLDADGAIDVVTSSDDVDSSKPEPDVFQAALRRGSLDRERAVVVGDSVWDILAARAAGLVAIAVESGGFSKHELSENGAFDVYRDVQEILDQVRTAPVSGLLGRLSGRAWGSTRTDIEAGGPTIDRTKNNAQPEDGGAHDHHLTGEYQAKINRENDPPA